jgi:hypothetical protein
MRISHVISLMVNFGWHPHRVGCTMLNFCVFYECFYFLFVCLNALMVTPNSNISTASNKP